MRLFKIIIMNLEAIVSGHNTASLSVDELPNYRFALIEFYTPWNGASHIMNPVIKEVQLKYKDQIKVFRIDIEKDLSTAKKLNIIKAPLFQIYNRGNLVEQFEGIISKKVLLNKLKIIMRNYH